MSLPNILFQSSSDSTYAEVRQKCISLQYEFPPPVPLYSPDNDQSLPILPSHGGDEPPVAPNNGPMTTQ